MSVGRIVHYRLSRSDIINIAQRRGTDSTSNAGNVSREGDIVPLIVVRVWPDEWAPGIPGINGQAILDGTDTIWVTSAPEGGRPGEWSWPELVGGPVPTHGDDAHEPVRGMTIDEAAAHDLKDRL
jgi:hypothetical protein